MARPYRKLTPGQRHAAQTMSALGYGKLATAKALGIDARTLAKLIAVRDARKGRSGRKPTFHPSARDARIVEEQAQGQTCQQIATRHGITRQRAQQIVARWSK